MLLLSCPLLFLTHVKDIHGHISVKEVFGHSLNDTYSRRTLHGEGWQEAVLPPKVIIKLDFR